MKFQVKVGQEFPCYVVEEHSTSYVFHVTQNVNTPSTDLEKRQARAWKELSGKVAWVVVALIGFVFAASAFFGWVTGDYSVLRSIAESGRDLLAIGVRLMTKS